MEKIFQLWLNDCFHQFNSHIALEYGTEQKTYLDLQRQSNYIGNWIVHQGIPKETFIGIYTPNRTRLIESIIGILYAGCVFVPLDPAHPDSRLETMIEKAEIKWVLCDSPQTHPLCQSPFLQNLGVTFISFDAIFDPSASGSDPRWFLEPPPVTYTPEDKIYIYFTSGTTGTPKAIIGKNKSLFHFIEWEIETFSIPQGFRISQWTTPGFDAFLRDVFVALCSGGTSCIPPADDTLLNADKLIEWTDRQHINLIHCVPSIFRGLNSNTLTADHFSSLKYIMLSGEKVTPSMLEHWYHIFGDRIQLVNYYGPSETTMIKTFYLIQPEDLARERIPVGKPMKGCRVAILDDEMKICDERITGEIYIRTPYRTHGYYKEDDLNREKFIANPLNNDPNDIVFRTGDLGRFLPDGSIEFLGRKDRQVKIRGVRVELEEIEMTLLSHPLVAEAAVIKKESGNNELVCAYITQKPGETMGSDTLIDRLTDYLKTKLPPYMIPNPIRVLDHIQKKPNGKIDYDSLPDPIRDEAVTLVPPQNEVQRKLARIWTEILGIDSIGITHNFFQLGGNSLNVISLISFIQRDFDIKPTLAEIFQHDTIEKQEALLRTAGLDPFASIEPAPIKEYYAVSSVQRRLFFLQFFDAHNMSYNMPQVFTLEGEYNREKIEEVFRKLIERHESLRTSFHVIDEEAKQKIHDDVAFHIEFVDLSSQTAPDAQTEAIITSFIRPFDLSQAPLFRVGIIVLNPTRSVFMIDTHHIVSDGVSQGIFNREFLALYQGEELPPLRIQYKDVAEWLNSDDQVQRSRQQEAYWLNRFEGELPLLTLPADVERPATQTFEGSEVVFELGESLTTSLKSYAIREDVTLYMALLALFNLVLSRLSGQEDIIVGTSLAGRRHADLEGIIGMFVNALALRNYPHGHQSFRDFLREVKQNTLEAFENQDYPFENLVEKVLEERVPGRNPLFDVMMVLNNEEYPEIRIAGLKLGAYPYHRQSAQMDLKFRMVEIGGDLSCTLEYSTGLFNEETIRRLANYFKTAVSAVLSDPSQTLSAIDLLPEDEKQKLLVDFNNVETDYPVDRPIHRFFEDQVRRTPDRIAVVDPSGATLTYDALNRKANGLARLLQKNGVGKESVVGIMMEPSIDMIAGLLAILKAGGAYLPIDVGVPAHRALFMLENAQSTALLTHGPALTHSTISFTALQNFESKQDVSIIKTPPRSHIQAFDSLPMPDRSLIDLSRYPDKIGMASVTPCMSLQATRGCPYECLFCHKVWSKKHVFRSAENIFNEVNYYYKRGVRHFAIIDDCFNLNRENSTRFFKLVIQNKLAIRLFFPNGLRGDLLTPDDIDLMVEAGTRGINLSLETASPRLQKLIKKNLDIDKFKKVMDVIATRHPEVILEIATMHGFPTETEDEALMTLDFIKSIRWIHFPYIHILKIYPNTEMEALALEHGVSKEDIMASKDLAFHQLPETLPFSKSFTREYQSDFMNNYFLSRERLKQVMPVQLRVMGQQAMVQKYDTYLPIEIQSIQDVIDFAKLDDVHLPVEDEDDKPIPEAFQQKADYPSESEYPASAKKILLLDLSQHFSSRNMLYNVVEQPLGLISLLTYIRQEFGDRIVGRIYKSGVDFDSYEELHALLESYHPDVIGIRTLTLFKEFFHETVSFLRQWGITAPIIAGGPYATSDYDTILKDRNIDLVVFGEGEYTFKELLQRMFETDSTDFKLPSHEVLQTICGIAYAKPQPVLMRSRAVLPVDDLAPIIAQQDDGNCDLELTGRNLAYVMYTSGSTGIPKGVMVEHRHANNCIWWMDDTFGLKETDAVVQRTNLSFDPSVWEIFWPLYRGAAIKLLTTYQRKDAEFLANLMANPGDAVMMYCPATLVSAITYYLDSKTDKPTLTLPWLIIGAEPISMETVKHFYHYYKGTIVNTYGPTECAINNTYYRLDPDDSRPIVPIGRPVTNNRLYILSPDLQPMAMNAVGEIHIAGNGVVRGYLNNPQLTSDKFLTPPPTNHPQTKSFWKSRNLFSKRFLASGGSTLYQTGDVGRVCEDGVIVIMGR
ncbi:MAG: amino acid adenylation domain-containing protein, partial [Candidatus Omnitrophota bacterium]